MFFVYHCLIVSSTCIYPKRMYVAVVWKVLSSAYLSNFEVNFCWGGRTGISVLGGFVSIWGTVIIFEFVELLH